MQSVPLRVSCPSPMCPLAGSQGGARPGPFLHLSPVPGSGSYAPSLADLCVRGGPAGGGGLGVRGAVSVPPCLGGVVWGGAGGGGQWVAPHRSVPLPPLGGHQSRLHRRSSVHGGCGLHIAPVCVLALPPRCGPRGALARQRRTAGLSRSLWEWAGDGLGRRGVWA